MASIFRNRQPRHVQSDFDYKSPEKFDNMKTSVQFAEAESSSQQKESKFKPVTTKSGSAEIPRMQEPVKSAWGYRLPINLTQALREVLHCSCCIRPLVEPYTLMQCFHTYCRACLCKLKKVTRNGITGYVCPICKTFTGDSDIRKNDFIVDLIQAVKDKKRQINAGIWCKQCLKKNGATMKCLDCQMELCDDCQEAHLRIPTLKCHQVVDIQFDTNNLEIDGAVCCKTHNSKIIEYCCKTCDVPTCHNCNWLEHRTHEIETVGEAIYRLLPEMRANTDKVRLNLVKLENQIDVVSENIEQTRNNYSVVKRKLTEEVEEMIKKLCAIKVAKDKDLDCHEAKDIEMLENKKQLLRNEIKKLRNISSVATVTMETSKNATLLNEMKLGLFDRLKELTRRELRENQLRQAAPDIHAWKASLVRDIKDSIKIDQKFKTDCCFQGDKSFLYDNFCKLFTHDLKKVGEIPLPGSWCHGVSCIDKSLWVGLPNDKQLRIYSFYGNLLRTIPTDRVVTIKQAGNGDLIVAGFCGLYVTNVTCSGWCKICDGRYNHLCIHGNGFSAMQYDDIPRIITFELSMAVKDKSCVPWKMVSAFELPREHFQEKHPRLNSNNTFMKDKCNNFIVANCKKRSLYEFTEDGQLHYIHNIRDWEPFICGRDQKGLMLIASYQDGKLYSIDTIEDFNYKALKLPKCRHLIDSVVDNDGNLWTLQGCSSYKLVRYEAI